MKKNAVASFDPILVREMGKAIGAFILENGIKSEYVRMASHFSASRFAPFKKAS